MDLDALQAHKKPVLRYEKIEVRDPSLLRKLVFPISVLAPIGTFNEHYEEEASKNERDGFRIAAAYKITPEFNLGALYQYTTFNEQGTAADLAAAEGSDLDKLISKQDTHVFGVAADYKFAPKTYLRGQVFHRDVDADDANATLLAQHYWHWV